MKWIRIIIELIMLILLINFITECQIQKVRYDRLMESYEKSVEFNTQNREFYKSIYARYEAMRQKIKYQSEQIEIQVTALQKNHRRKYRRQVVKLMSQVHKKYNNALLAKYDECGTIFSWRQNLITDHTKKNTEKCSTSSWIASIQTVNSSSSQTRTIQNTQP